jgi:hypothetical protein
MAEFELRGEINEIPERNRITDGVTINGQFYRYAHQNLLHRHFQLFPIERAGHFPYDKDFVGDMAWRERGSDPRFDSGL